MVRKPTVWNRCIQTLAVVHHIFLWIIAPLISLWLPLYVLLFTRLWWAMLAYFVWYLYDFKTPSRGSRNWMWYKNSSIWKHFADYFPIKLVRTKKIAPNRNYILGCSRFHILTGFCLSALLSISVQMALDSLRNSQVSNQLFLRYLDSSGFLFVVSSALDSARGVESSNRSLKYLLENPGTGRMIGIVVGGAEEALDARPGLHDLNIMNRRGFCRHALQSGAFLVPSYSFGENDIYEQRHNARGTPLRKIQTYIKKRFGFCPPLFTGCGFFSSSFGILPLPRPITTVVGEPIKLKRKISPSKAQVEALHSRYCLALTQLFEKHKLKYGVPAKVHLNLL